MKKLFALLVAATLLTGLFSSNSFALGEEASLVNEDFEAYPEGSGTNYLPPPGWTVYPAVENMEETNYVSVWTGGLLRLYNKSSSYASYTEKEFSVPDGGGLLKGSFDVQVEGQKGWSKGIKLMSGTTAGISVTYTWSGGDNIVLSNPIGSGVVIGAETAGWCHYEITANLSNIPMEGLEPGEYDISIDNGAPVRGRLLNGLKSLNKIRFESGNSDSGKTVTVDNVYINLIPNPFLTLVNEDFEAYPEGSSTNFLPPAGWTVYPAVENMASAVNYVTVVAGRSLILYNKSSSYASYAEKEFSVPDGGGLLYGSFDVTVSGQRGWSKGIQFLSGTTAGISVTYEWSGGGDKILLVNPTGSGNVVLGTEGTGVCHYEIIANVSDIPIGELESGEYTISLNSGAAVKGRLSNGLKSLNKVKFVSGASTSAKAVSIDNIHIGLQPSGDFCTVESVDITPIPDSDNVTAVLNFVNNGSVKNGTLIVVGYKGSSGSYVLNRITVENDRTIDRGETPVEVVIESPVEGEIFKAVYFNSLNTVTPLIPSKEFWIE